jgi:hypothetical protein
MSARSWDTESKTSDPGSNERPRMSRKTLVGISLVAVCAAACGREAQTAEVYDVVIKAMTAGQIPLRRDISGLPIAIASATLAEKRNWGDAYFATLRQSCGSAVDDYRRRRGDVENIQDTFHFTVPHEMVPAGTWPEIQDVRLLASGGLMRLSPVGFNLTRSQAFLFVTHACGPGNCATGHFICLSKTSGVWRITMQQIAIEA